MDALSLCGRYLQPIACAHSCTDIANMGKAKPAKHTAAEINAKIAAATMNKVRAGQEPMAAISAVGAGESADAPPRYAQKLVAALVAQNYISHASGYTL